MNLKEAVEKILSDQKRSLSWLAGSMDRTIDGFRLSLINGSIKYNDLVKLIEVLNVPVTLLFPSRQHIVPEEYLKTSGEPDTGYKKAVEALQEQVALLKNTVEDKNKIIELLSKK